MHNNHLHQLETETSGGDTDESRPMRRQTNVECIVKIMELSRCGALAQVFVIDALTKHAEAVAKLTDEQVASLDANPMVSMTAWRNVATEITASLKSHFAGVLVPDDSDEEA